MIYILFVASLYTGHTMATAEFNSKEDCQIAAAEIASSFKDEYKARIPIILCLKKGRHDH